MDIDQFMGPLDRHPSQEDGVHGAEDRRVRADTEGQGQQRHRREARTPDQAAQRVTQILPQFIHVHSAPRALLGPTVHGTAIASGIGQIAELAECFLTRGVGRHPAVHELTGPHVEMECQLGVDVVVDSRAAPPWKPELSAKTWEASHGGISAGIPRRW